MTTQLPAIIFSIGGSFPAFLSAMPRSVFDRLLVTLMGVLHGRCRIVLKRLGWLVVMKIEDLRYQRAAQGRWCERCWKFLCIICRSRRFASLCPTQFLQKRGVVENLAGNQVLSPAQDLRMNFSERWNGLQRTAALNWICRDREIGRLLGCDAPSDRSRESSHRSDCIGCPIRWRHRVTPARAFRLVGS